MVQTGVQSYLLHELVAHLELFHFLLLYLLYGSDKAALRVPPQEDLSKFTLAQHSTQLKSVYCASFAALTLLGLRHRLLFLLALHDLVECLEQFFILCLWVALLGIRIIYLSLVLGGYA